MGTDVHAVFERKINYCKELSRSEKRQFNNLSLTEKNKRRKTHWEFITSEWNQHRRYSLFSWLADVRNGFGFAGVKTNDYIEPISLPRGLPEDLKDIDYDCMEYYGEWLGDHSYSWLLGSEIIKAIKEITSIVRCGVITHEDYINWDKVSEPCSYYGDIWGGNIKIIKPEELNLVSTFSPEIKVYVSIEWKVSAEQLKEEFKYFTDEIKRLVELYGEIRMVFGFDN